MQANNAPDRLPRVFVLKDIVGKVFNASGGGVRCEDGNRQVCCYESVKTQSHNACYVLTGSTLMLRTGTGAIVRHEPCLRRLRLVFAGVERVTDARSDSGFDRLFRIFLMLLVRGDHNVGSIGRYMSIVL